MIRRTFLTTTLALAITLPALAKTPASAPALTERLNVDIPMRDGVILRADIFRPADDSAGPYPVLMARTPYNKNGLHGNAKAFAAAGYIVVCQDSRGRFASDGQWESFLRFDTNNARDGYDTVEWCAELPGSTGKVGTFGASYNAFLQWRTASLAPPSLVCMSAQSIPARYTDLEGPGAIRPGRRLQWWYGSMSPDLRKRSGSPGPAEKSEARKLWQANTDKWLNFLPFQKLPRQFWEDEAEPVLAWMKNPHTDPWALHQDVPLTTVPNLDAIGWFDHCNGDLMLNTLIKSEAKTEVARSGSRTLVGPWSHSGRGRRKVGEIDFGPNANVNLVTEQLRWFDHWLKGRDTGILDEAPYRIFVMGDNQWRDEPTWPLERAKMQTLYFGGGGKANTPGGDGKLLSEKPADEVVDEFSYDPADPVPTLFSAAAFTVPSNQKPLADRKDILVYQGEPLSERLEVTGNAEVELYAATSAADTDFFVRLIDVHPDGQAIDVALGLVRARYRNGLDQDQPITPGEVTKYQIKLTPTSVAFLPGHRIRVDITSSDYPNYDRNHNTLANPSADAELVIAKQSIFHGGAHATAIHLPLIEKTP